MPKKEGCDCCRYKTTPRDEKLQKDLQSRLNRIVGQLGGIGKMIEENRYCGDILIQVAAADQALKTLGRQILQNHMETCVTEEIKKGNDRVIAEAVDLIRRLS
ncbi:MAG: metal-sensing transcriptional repressor [Oscillospiraceae bacterium]|nr:metal-sensing transcriptional repressor [Oscillospiraceae bacterium]